MKKTTKLLSVILAVVMALSCMTVMASALNVDYKTVGGLTDLGAYSPYGTVTRLSTEERLDILFDSLDALLAKLNIKVNDNGEVDIKIAKLTIDLRSVDSLCKTLSSIKGMQGIIDTAGNLSFLGIDIGILKDVETSTWPDTQPTRASSGNLTIASEVLEFLSANTTVVERIFNEGINLGSTISGFLKQVDFTAINGLIKDLPGTIKGIVLPLMGRQDDDKTQRDLLSNKGADLVNVAQSFVNGLFTKPMNWTSYRVDAAGNSIGATLDLPTTPEGTSRYFEINADKTEIIQYDYKYAGLLGDPKAGFEKTVTYTKSKTEETEGSGVYLYVAPAGYNGDATLKWYKAGDPSGIDANNLDTVTDANGRVQSSYWLPSVARAFTDGTLTLEINGQNDTFRGLVYKFAPYLFREMATTVLNGSAKKRMAEAFDVKFTKIGLKDDAAVTAVADSMKTADDKLFFTEDQDYYVWEYSNYRVIDGVPYYRYQNQYFKGEIPKNISAYYYMFNWDWNIPDNFMDEFIPTSDGDTWALDGLNSLVKKAIDTMILPTWEVNGQEYTRETVFPWATANGNGDLLNNLMTCARNFFKIAPEEILDEYYMEAQFYDAMMNGNINQAVNGLVCELVKLIMPQIKFPTDIVNQPITSIAAVVVRELCSQLMPTYNFDAMIYANYNGIAKEEVRTLLTHTADEWLDITIYMGVNLGMYYLRNLADIGEDNDLGYYSVMSDLKAIPTVSNRNTRTAGDAMTFTAESYKLSDGTPSWLVAVDWVIDWALASNVEWAWRFDKLVNCGETVDLASYQNPFKKLNKVLEILPLNQIFNDSQVPSTTYGSNTFLENILKGGIVDSIVNLNLPKLLSIVKIPNDSALRKPYIADNIVVLVANLLNSILYKVAGNANLIDTNTIDSVSHLLMQDNIKEVVVNLVGKLKTAYDKGLLDTLLPFLNFFIGWKTDPQTYTTPEITFANDSGYAYFYTGSRESVTIRNASSGMLLKHVDDKAETPDADTAYSINVESITSDDGTINATLNDVIGPGETKSFDITTSDTSDRAVVTTLNYTFTGKDGKQVGADQKARAMTYVSAKTPSSSPVAESSEYKYSYILTTYVNFVRNAYDKVQFVDSAAAIENFAIGFTNKAGYATWVISADENTAAAAPLELDRTSYVHGTNENTELKDAGIGHMKDEGSMAIQFNNVLDETALVSGSAYNGGTVSLSIGNRKRNNDSKKGVPNLEMPTFYYYDSKALGDVRTAVNENVNVVQENYDTTAAGFDTDWAKFKAARDTAAKIGYQPMQTGTFATEYTLDNLEKVVNDLKDAKKVLDDKYPAKANVSVEKVQTTLDGIETNPNGDINYQDYRLFEYFQYEKQRTAAREMIKSATPPAAPESRIDNVWGNDLVNAIVGKLTGNVLTGVTATREDPTDEDTKNWERAKNDYRPAYHAELDIENQASLLTYYAQFMKANPKPVDLTFLSKEIAYAEAQNYVAAEYSTDSWARYEKALADAKAITADSLQSDAFNAKYELMVAQNKLLEKERSIKDNGYLDRELNVVIEQANNILTYYGTGEGKYYTLADNGITEEEALAQLVKALGVKYEVEVDGTTHKGILYDRSALTFVDYDRIATVKNMKAVDIAAEKLRDAIKNFKINVTVESTDTTAVKEVEQDVRFIQGITPGSITSIDMLLTKVKSTDGTTLTGAANKDGMFGTGATVTVSLPDGATAAKYFVVIYGDVNGDGAVDGIDTFTVDKHHNHLTTLLNVYETAGDADKDGEITLDDYSLIKDEAAGKGTVSQTVA